MRNKITFKEFIQTPMYNQMGTLAAKNSIWWFTIFCFYFAFFSEYKIGLLWLPIWFVGSFIVSLTFAPIINTIKVLCLIKITNLVENNNAKKWAYALNLIDLIFLVGLFLLLRWFLSMFFNS